ncbi:MAG: hypothetical protein ACT4P1_10780 [Sporichthyaceae bacterium]
MQHPLTFTTPPEPVHRARLAMARLQHHLAEVIGPLDPCTDLTGMAMAFMTLEDLYPSYAPMPDSIAASEDPQSDLDEAIWFLHAAMAGASTATDKLRYARTIRDLHDLDSVHPAAVNTGTPSGEP